jgi:MFS family permease
VVALALVAVAGGIVFNATTLALPKLFDERAAHLAADPVGLAALTSAVFVVGATGQIVVGRLIDRLPLKPVFIGLSLLQAPALALAAAAAGWPLAAAAAVLMFAVFGQMTINDSIVARLATDAWRARAFAVRYLVTFVAAATAVPLVAVLHDGAGGFRTTFLVLAGLGAAVFLAALLFPAMRRGEPVGGG